MEKIKNRFWRFLNKRSRKKNKEISLRYPHHYYCSILLSPKTEHPKTKLGKKKESYMCWVRLQRLIGWQLLDKKSLSSCMAFNTLTIQKLDWKLTCPASPQFLNSKAFLIIISSNQENSNCLFQTNVTHTGLSQLSTSFPTNLFFKEFCLEHEASLA